MSGNMDKRATDIEESDEILQAIFDNLEDMKTVLHRGKKRIVPSTSPRLGKGSPVAASYPYIQRNTEELRLFGQQLT
ncbi:hypothetical protein PsorP6_001726 [Peronosclerospora sorghi]|uniref:Uncharacterized protein n=1 Tax=Peronosclerospora sorghi TaxID=230839 RepID=A0ACC0WUC2_9STRA|nr:hypothetical protein PsorP6_001726 [Peronosclerospora sorghi]